MCILLTRWCHCSNLLWYRNLCLCCSNVML